MLVLVQIIRLILLLIVLLLMQGQNVMARV